MPRTLEMNERLNIQFFSTSTTIGSSREVLDNGNTLLRGIKVFRTGTFKDSMGIQHTWEPEHLEQMVFHYGLLKDRGIFPHGVPWRDGHKELFGGGGEVIGWVTDLQTQDGFLLADYEVTEPEALAKVDRGTFRARSAEVGYYETNDEAMYWPVFMGVAFVDIGAVEGLFSKEKTTRKFSMLTDPEEGTPVSGENNTSQTQSTAPAQPDGGTAPAQQPQAPTPAQPAPPAQPNATGAEAAPAPQQAPSQHAAPVAPTPGPGTVATFVVNGQPTQDFGAVQRHITALETAASEQADNARREFVTGLAGDNRIAATQVESLTAHALSLSDEQFTSFRASFENAPTTSLLGQHGGGPTNLHGGGSPVDDEIAVNEEIVANHRRAGMKDEAIKKTPSYQRLQELKSATK